MPSVGFISARGRKKLFGVTEYGRLHCYGHCVVFPIKWALVTWVYLSTHQWGVIACGLNSVQPVGWELKAMLLMKKQFHLRRCRCAVKSLWSSMFYVVCLFKQNMVSLWNSWINLISFRKLTNWHYQRGRNPDSITNKKSLTMKCSLLLMCKLKADAKDEWMHGLILFFVVRIYVDGKWRKCTLTEILCSGC